MTITWHEEYTGRRRFPVDSEGNSQALPPIPLESEWLKNATGMWLKVWGVGNGGGDWIFKSEVWTLDGFEGPEEPNGEVQGNVVNVLNVNGTFSSPSTMHPEHGYVWSDGSGGWRGAYASRLFYTFPNMGAGYAGLALQLTPDPFEEGAEANPEWAAARIWYKVEH